VEKVIANSKKKEDKTATTGPNSIQSVSVLIVLAILAIALIEGQA